MILGLDRLLAVVGRREKEEAPAPGRDKADVEMGARIDAARERLRREIDPRKD